ncbi:unnamed protein product [Rhizophagus irregularis]|nr:unnamed protein product [Rhizophagus irregularis]
MEKQKDLFAVFNLEKRNGFFWRTRLRITKGIFGVLTLGNEKPKGTPDVWMMEIGIETNRYTLDSFQYWISVSVFQGSEMAKWFRAPIF